MDLLDGVNKVVSITCGVAEAEDSDRLVLQIERFDVVEKPVPVGSTALRSSASVPRWGANDESVVCFEARNTRLAYFLYFGGLARLFLRTFSGIGQFGNIEDKETVVLKRMTKARQALNAP